MKLMTPFTSVCRLTFPSLNTPYHYSGISSTQLLDRTLLWGYRGHELCLHVQEPARIDDLLRQGPGDVSLEGGAGGVPLEEVEFALVGVVAADGVVYRARLCGRLCGELGVDLGQGWGVGRVAVDL